MNLRKHKTYRLSDQENQKMGLFNKKNKSADSNTNKSAALKISVSNEGAEYTFIVEGRLDTNTSPELEAKINEVIGDAKKLIIDLQNLEYVSSAGLRVLLGATQVMEDKGEMVVRNVTEAVKEIFDLTGFNNVFKIE